MRWNPGSNRLVRGLAATAGSALMVLGVPAASQAATITVVAQDVPTMVTIAPGASAVVPVTVKNTGGAVSSGAGAGSVVFNAPVGATFPAQLTVPVQWSADGVSWVNNAYTATGCTVSNAGATLTCTAGGAFSWSAGSYFRFNPTVTVDAAEPPATTLPHGTSDFQFTMTSSPGNVFDVPMGTLNIQTPPTSGGPVVTVAGLGAAGGLAMLGACAFVAFRRRTVVAA